ncbi:MAG: T9SS type A sorting domain-containing protein, partial [Saprospiraceae bacterium]
TVSLAEQIQKKVLIYPNPTDGSLTINFGTQVPERYTIFNAIGEVVYLNTQPMTTELLDLGNLSSGVYTISFLLDGEMWTEKVVVY